MFGLMQAGREFSENISLLNRPGVCYGGLYEKTG